MYQLIKNFLNLIKYFCHMGFFEIFEHGECFHDKQLSIYRIFLTTCLLFLIVNKNQGFFNKISKNDNFYRVQIEYSLYWHF